MMKTVNVERSYANKNNVVILNAVRKDHLEYVL